MPEKVPNTGKTCFFVYHDDCFVFGLTRDNSKINDDQKYEWVYPTAAKRKVNSTLLNNLL